MLSHYVAAQAHNGNYREKEIAEHGDQEGSHSREPLDLTSLLYV